MTDTSEENISYLQANEKAPNQQSIEQIREKISELLNVKNLHFLLGSGTSSQVISTMKALHTEIKDSVEKDGELNHESKLLYKTLSTDNLETALSILYAKKFYLDRSSESTKDQIEATNSLIEYVQNFIYAKINIATTSENAKRCLETYIKFYQKITLRNKELSRVNVFTTNNDLFNERALDYLNFNFNNGFGGGIDRVFNPARFRYTFSKKIDTNLEKFEPLEDMAYLFKLHGSINWVEKEKNALFNITEVPITEGSKKTNTDHVLIYPTPLKQSQSLGAPYSDLIREFQSRLSLPNSALFIIGYSFSDEHINNIIYQSLAANSSLSVVIFGEHPTCALCKISDSRVYRAFGTAANGEKIHYFKYFVENLLPNLDENKEKQILEGFIRGLIETGRSAK